MAKHADAPSSKQPESVQSRIENDFYGNAELLPVRVNDGGDTWLIQEAAYFHNSKGLTFEEAVMEDLKRYGVEIHLEGMSKPGAGGETVVLVKGPFNSVMTWLSKYFRKAYIAKLTPEQIDAGRDAIKETMAERRRQSPYYS